MIEELFDALGASGVNAGPEELAEILWLAARIDGPGIRPPDHPSDAHVDGSAQPPRALDSPSPAASSTDPPPAEQFYSAADITDTPGSAPRHADLVRVRRAASLHDPLAVMRALRPLGRHAGLPGDAARGELDEELTVRSTIEQCLPVPVIRPCRGRWLDLALVVDTHHSMRLWHDLVTELRRVFAQTGIFRDVRTWYLSGTGPDEAPSVARASGEPRSVQEVADPAGHRLVLVVTDTVADGWNTSGVQDVLRHWSSHGPVALLNVLPRRLWDRGAVRPQPHMVRAPKPAAPNTSWRLGPVAGSRRSQRRRDALAEGIAIPVVEVSASSISALAELVAGGGRWSRLPCLTVSRSPEGLTASPPVPPGPVHNRPVAVDEILRHFRAGASPIAQTLAGYLSAVPLNLPVMNLVRQIMLPDSEPGHLAEVALGGLFESWERAARDGRTDMEQMPFRFRAGVREALLGSQRRHEITTVQELVRREMGAFVTQRGAGPVGDFLAARGAAAGGDGSRTISPDALPFADRVSTPSPVGLPVREAPPSHEDHLLRYIERNVDARLREAMGRAVNGHSTLAVLVGEPGSGKTYAAARATQEMPDDWRAWSPDASLTLARGAPDVGPRTVVMLNDLQTYTTVPGFPIADMARTLRDLIEDTQRAPVMILGTLTPTAWDSLVAMAEGSSEGFESDRELRRLIDHAEVIRISPVDATPKRWPDEPSHTRLVMIASTSDPAHAGSGFKQLGTGFLLGPRLVLTAAHIQDRRSRLEKIEVCSSRGTVTADSWVDCRVLWSHDAYDAALLLAENNLAEPATDSHFSLPHWAQLTGDEPLSPCHITGVTVADRAAPQASGHLAGVLYLSPSHLEAAYEFEPSSPLPRSLEKAMAGAPVFSEGFLLGFVIGRSAGSRLAVAGISTLVNEGDFTEFCRPYMPGIPPLQRLPATPTSPAEGDRTNDTSARHPPPRVFISYTHEDDNGAHAEQIHNLVEVLSAAGINVRLNAGELEGSRDWAARMRHEMEAADVILAIASPEYKRHADTAQSDTASQVRVASEARLLRNELAHGPENLSRRILPVLLPGSTTEDLPAFLRPLRPLAVDTVTHAGIAQLLDRIPGYAREDSAPAREVDPARVHALIVGVERYDAGTPWDLPGPARDAVRFHRLLREAGVPETQLRLHLAPLPPYVPDVRYEPADQATLRRVLIRELPLAPGEILWVWWGGHGTLDQAGQLRLLCSDATTTDKLGIDLHSAVERYASDAVPALGKQLWIVDACEIFEEDLPSREQLPPDALPVWRWTPTHHQTVLRAAAGRRGSVHPDGGVAGYTRRESTMAGTGRER
ncbi:SAV_2336 N-terminal domain-related protein, partial [Streptomyces lincolnensis]|uniref:SAV_2336 N-terminal domain-related protein n=1 Tax=Streptomyces lincolnensis TaxID=1915 RepID=UPI0033C0749C